MWHPGAAGARAIALEIDAARWESYRRVRDGVLAFLPLEPAWVGALTELYFKAPQTLTETNRATWTAFAEGGGEVQEIYFGAWSGVAQTAGGRG